MELEVLQEELSKGLATVSRFVASRPQLPVLTNILFTATDDNKLCLSATNLDIGIQYWLDAKVQKPGQITIPAKEINEFVSYLAPGKLSLKTKGKTKLHLLSNGGEGKFSGMEASEFPEIPSADDKKTMAVPLEKLDQAVNLVSFAAADDNTRPVLSAINWQFGDQEYRMVTTDGYRLSLKDVKEVEISQEGKAFLVPARSLTEIIRLTNREEEIKVGLTKDENQVVFMLPNLQLTSRLIEGEFPNYQEIIPDQKETSVSVNKDEFLSAVRAASVFARESANVVKFSIKDNKLVISANAPSVGENKNEIGAQLEGEKLEIAFNYRFLIDFLQAVPVEEEVIEMEFNESLSPGVFKAPTDKDWLHIIMPVRVDL